MLAFRSTLGSAIARAPARRLLATAPSSLSSLVTNNNHNAPKLAIRSYSTANTNAGAVLPPHQDIKLTMNSSKIDNNSLLVHASVQPPPGTARTPSDICCVVDVSGSMGSEAGFKNQAGQWEYHGLTSLDIVKHAVKTIAHSLGPEDRLAVVAYSTTAWIELPLTPVTEINRDTIVEKVNALRLHSSTNLWDGLKLGIDILASEHSSSRLSSLFLLTDGLPNVSPPRGEVLSLKLLKQDKPFPCSISTFGFGYDIDSTILHSLALEGDGTFSFIPDSSMVGTVFINTIANSLISTSNNAKVSLFPEKDTKVVEVMGLLPTSLKTNRLVVNLSSLQNGQSKDIIFKTNISSSTDAPVSASLAYVPWSQQDLIEVSSEVEHKGGYNKDLEYHRHRAAVVAGIESAWDLATKGKFTEAQNQIDDLTKDITNSTKNFEEDPRIQGLLEDLKGQVALAVSRQEYFDRWGRHYLLSLKRSHQLQQCNNFKDPGVQFYGGPFFKTIRDQMEAIYCKLPPPKPSLTPRTGPIISMGVYHCSSNPCFDGESTVLMSDFFLKKVKDLRRGDLVMTPKGTSTRIECVMKTRCEGASSSLVTIPGHPGLKVTPYHPIRIQNNGATQWTFPVSISAPAEAECSAVYSFLLASEHVMLIGGVECVTLGHGFEGDVVGHPYFGTNKVVDDLKMCRGWARGLVEMEEMCMRKNPETGLADGLLHNKEVWEEQEAQADVAPAWPSSWMPSPILA